MEGSGISFFIIIFLKLVNIGFIVALVVAVSTEICPIKACPSDGIHLKATYVTKKVSRETRQTFSEVVKGLL